MRSNTPDSLISLTSLVSDAASPVIDSASKLFEKVDLGRFYMIGTAFRALDILIIFNHAWFFSGSSMGLGPFALALVSALTIVFIASLGFKYYQYYQDKNLDAARKKVESMQVKFNWDQQIKKHTTMLENTQPHYGRFAAFGVVAAAVVFSSGLTATHILTRWTAGSATLEGLFIVTIAAVSVLLLACLYKQYQTIKNQNSLAQQLANKNTLMQVTAEGIAAIYYNLPNAGTAVTNQKSKAFFDKAEIEKVCQLADGKPPKQNSCIQALKMIYQHAVSPLWDAVMAGSALLCVIDSVAQGIFSTPSFFSFSAAPWVMALEICLALLIVTPYVMARYRDNCDATALQHFSDDYYAALRNCAEVVKQLDTPADDTPTPSPAATPTSTPTHSNSLGGVNTPSPLPPYSTAAASTASFSGKTAAAQTVSFEGGRADATRDTEGKSTATNI